MSEAGASSRASDAELELPEVFRTPTCRYACAKVLQSGLSLSMFQDITTTDGALDLVLMMALSMINDLNRNAAESSSRVTALERDLEQSAAFTEHLQQQLLQQQADAARFSQLEVLMQLLQSDISSAQAAMQQLFPELQRLIPELQQLAPTMLEFLPILRQFLSLSSSSSGSPTSSVSLHPFAADSPAAASPPTPVPAASQQQRAPPQQQQQRDTQCCWPR